MIATLDVFMCGSDFFPVTDDCKKCLKFVMANMVFPAFTFHNCVLASIDTDVIPHTKGSNGQRNHGFYSSAH